MSCPVAIDPPLFGAYQRPAFLSLIEGVYDLERIDDLIGPGRESFPVVFRSRKAWRRGDAFMLPFHFYAQPAVPGSELGEQFLASVQDWSRRSGHNLVFSTLQDYPRAASVQIGNNPLLHLPGDQSALESGYSRNLRNSIKRNLNKASRMGVILSESAAEPDMHEFYHRVLAPQYVRKHRMVFHPYALYRGLLQLGMARLTVARMNGRLIGGLVLVEDGEGIHYAWGASETPEQLAVGTLMLHFALSAAVAKGLRWFDLGSTPLSDAALLDFKLRWGSQVYPVRRYYTLQPPREIDLNDSFMLLRRLYAMIPPSWLCPIMPRIVPWLVS